MTDAYLDTDWSLVDFDDVPARRLTAAPSKPIAPGDCPKCGKHIGKGVTFHAKTCKG